MTDEEKKIWDYEVWLARFNIEMFTGVKKDYAILAVDDELIRLRAIEQRAGDVGKINKVLSARRHPNQSGGCLECYEDARAVSAWLLDPYADQRAYEDEHDRIKMGRK